MKIFWFTLAEDVEIIPGILLLMNQILAAIDDLDKRMKSKVVLNDYKSYKRWKLVEEGQIRPSSAWIKEIS
jgi:hypothetical protein